MTGLATRCLRQRSSERLSTLPLFTFICNLSLIKHVFVILDGYSLFTEPTGVCSPLLTQPPSTGLGQLPTANMPFFLTLSTIQIERHRQIYQELTEDY
jgi:hypothetical protein